MPGTVTMMSAVSSKDEIHKDEETGSEMPCDSQAPLEAGMNNKGRCKLLQERSKFSQSASRVCPEACGVEARLVKG